MKRTGFISILIATLLVIQYFCFPVFATASEDASVLYGCHSIDAQVPLLGEQQLVENARAMILFDANSDTLLYAWNADERMYPASLAKIVTAIVVIEQGTMADLVTVTADTLATIPEDAARYGFSAGEVISVEALLYCMMVDSANDAAAILANYLCGTEEAFAAEMNRFAEELHCKDTNFVNPHGLHDDQQYTTARDITRILSAALKNELFREIFETVYYTMPATNMSGERWISTGNYLMNKDKDKVEIYYDPRVTGGRTGVTTDGERCIASTARKGELELISIIMGSKSSYNEGGLTNSFGGYQETSDLLDYGFDGLKTAQIFYEDQAVRQCKVVNGDTDLVLGSQVSLSTILPQGVKQTNLTYRYTDSVSAFEAPIEKGMKLSNLEVWYGNICIAQADLYAMNHVPTQQSVKSVVQDPNKASGWTTALKIIGLCLAVLIIAVIIYKVLYKVRLTIANARKRRHRKNRRRSR